MSTHNFVSCIASLTICLSSLFCLLLKESVPNFLSIHFFPYQNTNRQPSKGIPSLHGKSHAHLKKFPHQSSSSSSSSGSGSGGACKNIKTSDIHHSFSRRIHSLIFSIIFFNPFASNRLIYQV